jgi:hypothetical protein
MNILSKKYVKFIISMSLLVRKIRNMARSLKDTYIFEDFSRHHILLRKYLECILNPLFKNEMLLHISTQSAHFFFLYTIIIKAEQAETEQHRKNKMFARAIFCATLIQHLSKQGKVGPIRAWVLSAHDVSFSPHPPIIVMGHTCFHMLELSGCAPTLLLGTHEKQLPGDRGYLCAARCRRAGWTQGLAAARPRLALPFFAPQLLYYAALYIRFDHKLCRLSL